MERTQIYLTTEQKAALDKLSKQKSVPMADLVREAVNEYVAKNGADYRLRVFEETFGGVPEWRDVSSVEYAHNQRSGWARRVDRSEGRNDK